MVSCANAAVGQACGLGAPDPWHILPVLAGATQLISSVMFQPIAQPKTVDPQQKMMQSMQYYFPLITVFIAWSLPAGLGLYWVTTTLFGIVQQYFVSGWGQLPRFLPFLKNIPSPADRTLAARQQAALEEERRDMSAKAALASNGPGAQNTREARRQRKANNNKKK
jgi:YidC/Oxa1 family membrane protein insertase